MLLGVKAAKRRGRVVQRGPLRRTEVIVYFKKMRSFFKTKTKGREKKGLTGFLLVGSDTNGAHAKKEDEALHIMMGVERGDIW